MSTIKAERYGGGHRWYCTNCDVRGFTITWTNSTPPPFCIRCGIDHQREAAQDAVARLRQIYQEQAVFPGSIRAIADLCEKHSLVPIGVRKTHFARLINEVTG